MSRSRNERDQEALLQIFLAVSDVQVAKFGVYELAAFRYEVLYGLQGVTDVTNPDLLSTYIEPPAAFSSTGQQAFRRQQRQALRYAAQYVAMRATGAETVTALPSAVGDERSTTERGRGRVHGRGKGSGCGGRQSFLHPRQLWVSVKHTMLGRSSGPACGWSGS